MGKRFWLIFIVAATAVAADSALTGRVGSTGFVQVEAENLQMAISSSDAADPSSAPCLDPGGSPNVFDPKLRDQVVARYQRLDLPRYWAGIDSLLTPSFDAAGTLTAVAISYPRDYLKVQLGYAALYGVQ